MIAQINEDQVSFIFNHVGAEASTFVFLDNTAP